MRHPLSRCPRAYEDYYAGQAGGAIPVFSGGSHRGRGLGSILGGLGRSVMPLLKSGGKALLKQGLSSGMRLAQDVMGGKNIKSALKHRSKEAGANLLNRAMNHSFLQPPGKPAIKRRAGSKTAPRKKKRKINKTSDIFG